MCWLLAGQADPVDPVDTMDPMDVLDSEWSGLGIPVVREGPVSHRTRKAHTETWSGTGAPLGEVTLSAVGPLEPRGIQWR